MPVIAIGGAIIAGAIAAPAIGAVIAGGLGALTLGGALSIVTAVGATLGAVGVVTGDKGLMTAGMVLGGIGGIGSLAVGAGLFGAGAGASSIFGDAAGTSAFADSIAVTPEIVGSNVGGFLGAGGAAGTDLVDAFGGIKPQAVSVSSLEAPNGAASTASASDNLTSDLLKPAAASAPLAPTTPSSMPTPVSSAPLVPAAPTAPSSLPQGTSAGTAPIAPSVEAPGMLDAFGNFIKNDKSGMTSYGLIQAGGSLISGLFDPLKPAQVKALNANTAQTQAQTGLLATQQANINAPIPVASRLPTGMINTGAAA